MDFKLTPEQQALRKEFEEFAEELMKDAPPGWETSMEFQYSDEGWEFTKRTHESLAEKGWLVRHWSKEYGGVNAPIIEQLIYSEAMGSHRVPAGDIISVGMIGPTLLAIGSEEHKQEHLPPIARAERYWCEGWSEPNAGSDLASLTARAVKVGDKYVVNGQKTWTSGAHRADWGFMLFRTDLNAEPKHRGLSFILVDMKSPGITVVPIPFMNFMHMFNEVYFDDVEIPVRYLIGEENQGWHIMRAAMNSERSNVGDIMKMQRDIEDLVEYCHNTKADGELLSKNPLIRNRLAEIACEIEAARALAYRVAWLQNQKKGYVGPGCK